MCHDHSQVSGLQSDEKKSNFSNLLLADLLQVLGQTVGTFLFLEVGVCSSVSCLTIYLSIVSIRRLATIFSLELSCYVLSGITLGLTFASRVFVSFRRGQSLYETVSRLTTGLAIIEADSIDTLDDQDRSKLWLVKERYRLHELNICNLLRQVISFLLTPIGIARLSRRSRVRPWDIFDLVDSSMSSLVGLIITYVIALLQFKVADDPNSFLQQTTHFLNKTTS